MLGYLYAGLYFGRACKRRKGSWISDLNARWVETACVGSERPWDMEGSMQTPRSRHGQGHELPLIGNRSKQENTMSPTDKKR